MQIKYIFDKTHSLFHMQMCEKFEFTLRNHYNMPHLLINWMIFRGDKRSVHFDNNVFEIFCYKFTHEPTCCLSWSQFFWKWTIKMVRKMYNRMTRKSKSKTYLEFFMWYSETLNLYTFQNDDFSLHDWIFCKIIHILYEFCLYFVPVISSCILVGLIITIVVLGQFIWREYIDPEDENEFIDSTVESVFNPTAQMMCTFTTVTMFKNDISIDLYRQTIHILK